MTGNLGDRYELGDRLASGGMADVFVAHDRRLDRRVAVKLLRSELTDPTARTRFEQEALTIARVAHPNVVAVYDVGEAERRPYIVMELVDGPSLGTTLAQRGALPVDEAVTIADQVLDALAAAHAEGVIHRDVKPGNILLDGNGRAKLADFGIAKAVADTTGALTSAGQVIGTPKYLSPEQVAGQTATSRSDLYAMGIVLYEMLAGEPPFAGDSAVALALAHHEAPVPPLRDRRPDVPPALEAAVERSLAKDPGERHPDADHMRAALHGSSLSATQPVTVPPTLASDADPTAALTEAAAAPARRRFAPVVLAGLAALALLGAAALVLQAGDRSGSTDPNLSGDTAEVDVAAEPPETTPPPPPEPPPEPEPREPETIAELIGLVAQDPGAYGEKGRDLLDDLLELQEEDPEDVGEETAKLIREIEEWVEDGELDPAIGALAVRILQPMADEPERGGGRGRDDD